jgi:hypothetical protein
VTVYFFCSAFFPSYLTDFASTLFLGFYSDLSAFDLASLAATPLVLFRFDWTDAPDYLTFSFFI